MRFTALLILPLAIVSSSYKASAQAGKSSTQQAETPYFNSAQLEIINRVELFPNPVKDYLQVKILNSKLVNTQFEMHSIIGNVVLIEAEETGGDSYRIPVEGFASGYYFLVIKDDVTRFKEAFKFLKKD